MLTLIFHLGRTLPNDISYLLRYVASGAAQLPTTISLTLKDLITTKLDRSARGIDFSYISGSVFKSLATRFIGSHAARESNTEKLRRSWRDLFSNDAFMHRDRKVVVGNGFSSNSFEPFYFTNIIQKTLRVRNIIKK